jgi:hypothetical protein
MALVDDGYAALGDLRRAMNAGEEMGFHVFLNVRPSRQRRETWYRISLARELSVQLADAARRVFSDLEATAAGEQNLGEFDFDSMVGGSVGVINLRDAEGLGDWLDALPLPDFPTVFDGDEEVLGRAKFYAFRLTLPDGRNIRAFRGRSGLEIAARKRNAVAAAFHRDTNQMVPVDGAVVTFDQNVDFFEWDGLLYVANIRSFESITNIREITVAKAHDAVEALAARFDLGNIDALKVHVQQRTRLGKRLASAHKHGLAADLDPAEIEKLIGVRKLQFKCEQDGGRLKFDLDHANNRSIEDFVDLVSDVFLTSPVTRRDWEALAKRPPRR